MNIELLRRVKDAIRHHPDNFDMDWWANGGFSVPPSGSPPCGTTACIGGWITELAGLHLDGLALETSAAKLAGVSDAESCPLFYADEWPSEIYDDYLCAEMAGNHAEVAAAACRAIDWWIAANGGGVQ